MNEIILYETEYGTIQIESFERAKSSRGNEHFTVKKKFDEAVSVIKSIGNSVVTKVKEISDSPDEVSVELGIKFTAEAGAIIAKTSTEGTLKLTLKWKKDTQIKS
jgi:hypothetical protein